MFDIILFSFNCTNSIKKKLLFDTLCIIISLEKCLIPTRNCILNTTIPVGPVFLSMLGTRGSRHSPIRMIVTGNGGNLLPR